MLRTCAGLLRQARHGACVVWQQQPALASSAAGSSLRPPGGGRAAWQGLLQRPFSAQPEAAEASVQQPAPGPVALYEQKVAEGAYRPDPRQAMAVNMLQRVYDDLLSCDTAQVERTSGLTLVDASGSGSPNWSLWTLLRSEPDDMLQPKPVKGLYLYGGVGCGKTMLMDLFHDSLPGNIRKKRVHFHDFMLDVHQRLRRLQSTADPLQELAKDLTRANKPGGGRLVLCLDEFMVTDVADAMILKRLFVALFDCGLVLISTSNRAPDALYEGGLQRNLFLPFIGLLKEQCTVHDIQGGQDYRLLAKKLAQPMFFTGETAEAELEACVGLFSGGAPVTPRKVEVMMGRELPVPRAAGKVAVFSFAELCERPVAAADYIGLCEEFHTILLSGVPRFTAASRSGAYRFVTLVDVVYEERVRLICSAEAPPPELFKRIVTQSEYRAHRDGAGAEEEDGLCVDDNVGFAKDRTVSRLIEMQSLEYARAHAEEHAPELLPSLQAAKSQQVV